MRFVHLAALFLVCLPARVAADEAISAKTLAAIKQATVYVKVQSEGINVSGSGFVMKVDGDSALIVTNHHVIEPKFKVIVPGGPRTLPKKPSKIKRPRPLPPPVTTTSPRTLILTLKNTSVAVVFDSGTKKEREAKAEVVAADPQHDLAVLRVKDVKNLP